MTAIVEMDHGVKFHSRTNSDDIWQVSSQYGKKKDAINDDDPMIMLQVILPFHRKRRVTQEQHGRISICKGGWVSGLWGAVEDGISFQS